MILEISILFFYVGLAVHISLLHKECGFSTLFCCTELILHVLELIFSLHKKGKNL